MSQRNIDAVLGSIAAYNAEDLDAQMATYAPDAVIIPVSDFPQSSPIVGREALREWVGQESRDWRARYIASEVSSIGGDHVLSRGEWGGIGVTSGIEAYQSMSVLFTLRDGLIIRAEFYRDHDAALKAARSEQQSVSTNLDLVRSIYPDWERGDFSRSDWAHPEIEFMMVDGPDPSSGKGLAGLAETNRDFLRDWEELGVEADEYRELDDERVLVLTRRTGRGRTSGLAVGQLQTKSANLFHIRADMVILLVFYWDRDRAFADLGLTPEGDKTVDMAD